MKIAHAFLLAALLAGSSGAAAEASETLEADLVRLVETADFTGISISPNGRQLAYRVERASVATNTSSSEWHVASLDEPGTPDRVADGGEPIKRDGVSVMERPRWSEDSRSLFFRALKGDDIQIWRLSVGEGDVEQVTKDPANILAFELLDDEGIVYEVGATRAAIEAAEQREFDNGIRVDATTPIGRNLFRSGWLDGRLATERYTGNWVQSGGLLNAASHRFQYLGKGAGTPHEATAPQITAFRRLESTSPALSLIGVDRSSGSDQSPAVRLVKIGDQQHLIVTGIGPGGDIACPDPACGRARWFAWRGVSRQIVFGVRDPAAGNATSLYVWTVGGGVVRKLVAAGGYLNGGSPFDVDDGCAVTDSAAFCVAASAVEPPRLVRLDLESGGTRVVYDPNAGEPSEFPRVKAELLRWSDKYGRIFTGQYISPTSPPGARKSPLFVSYYSCGGYLRGAVGNEWPLEALAKSGIAVLCINQAPADTLGPANTDGNSVRDYDIALGGIESAVTMLSARGVDPKRIGMGGLSFGSGVTMWVASHSDLLAAASIATSVISETYYRQRVLLGDRFLAVATREWGLGDPAVTPEQWRLRAPQYRVDKLRLPLLMQLSEQEYLTAVDYFVPLIRSNAPTEVYVFPNEPHVKFLPVHKLAAYERNLDWFRYWLLGKRDSDPAKAAQYERWDGLAQDNATAGEGATTSTH